LNCARLARRAAGRLKCHPGRDGGGAVDRFECDGLFLAVSLDDLARYLVEAHHGGSRRAVLAVNNDELATRGRGNDNGSKTRPGKSARDAIHFSPPAPRN
jgi:hypothetical protein